jgi:hypothetical protein
MAAGLAGAAVIVTGCGSTGTEPAASGLVAAMQNSVRSAESVHIDGRLLNKGVPVGVDMDVHRNGDVTGTISQDGAAFQLIGVDGKVFIKATPAFLRQTGAPPSACSEVCGKWVELAQQQADELTGDLSMGSMTGLLAGHMPKFSEAGSSTVGGRPAWVLRAADGSTLDVSSQGAHYPLQAKTAGAPPDVVTYSRWNSIPAPIPPPADEVLNLNGVR